MAAYPARIVAVAVAKNVGTMIGYVHEGSPPDVACPEELPAYLAYLAARDVMA